ncbi:MAG: DUF2721 domain-containing protein [Gemmatimonadaceae bacterium]|nr:DUF2721 domain-containing protein [Gemmatimonadaceae bacterium]
MPQFPSPTLDIAHVIQQAVAPVFLLTGVAAMLNVLTNRLARVIDRARQLEKDYHDLPIGNERHVVRDRMATLSKRSRLINVAITLCTSCALLICIVIMTLFVAAMIDVSASRWIAGLFVLAILALIGGLVSFLREIFVATSSVRIDPPQDRIPRNLGEAS